MTYPYQDAAEAAEGLLPGIVARGKGGAYFAALQAQQGLLDEDVASIFEALEDLSVAAGATLDIAGDLVLEKREGLEDFEYRRIIAGRRVARAGAVTAPRVWAGWVALTGLVTGRLYELPPSSVLLTAEIAWRPSEVFLARAGRVVRALTAEGVETNAILSVPGTAKYGQLPGYSEGRYAYTLKVKGS